MDAATMRFFSHFLGSSGTILTLIVLWCCPEPSLAKRLVVFAGPHKTSETSIEEFFYSYAHGPGAPDQGASHQQALKHWIWPQLHSSAFQKLHSKTHDIFGHLVKDADSPEIQKALLDGIQGQYAKAAQLDGDDFQGMILGSEELDRVGPNPYSDADAIDAVRRVVESIPSLTPLDVTIVLLYQIPRWEQWLSIFTHLPIEVKKGSNQEKDPYHEFLCNPVHARNNAWDALWNAMHPLRVATQYASQGYNVQVLDLSGIHQTDLDVEHVIGCYVLNGECDADGYLINLREESYLKQGQAEDETTNRFPDLTDSQQADLEALFRLRDCTYSALKTHGGVISLEYEDEMLKKECSSSEQQMSELLMDTNFFLNALQSQVGCNAVPVSISDILDGTAVPPDENAIYSWDVDYAAISSTSNTSSGDGNSRPSWTMPAFLLIFIGVGAMGLVWVRRSDIRQKGRYSTPTPRDLELHVTTTTNLSNIT